MSEPIIIRPPTPQEMILSMCAELPADRKPTLPEVDPIISQLYATPNGGAGCCLHIVVDDGNIDDDDVAFCVQEAERREHPWCEALARVMLRMSKTQRRKVSGR